MPNQFNDFQSPGGYHFNLAQKSGSSRVWIREMVVASSLSLGVLYPQVPAFRHNQEDGKSQCWTGM